MKSAERTVCIVLHDAAPSTRSACVRTLAAIRDVAGDAPVTILAVPRYHDEPSSASFEAWLGERVRRGDELALHGCTHRDDGTPQGWIDGLRRSSYTRGEGEFWSLSRAEALARIDVLVNNAGMNIPEDFVDVSEEHLDRILALNVKGAFLVAQAAARRMVAAGGGSIIHMASQLGHVGREGRFWYCTHKASMVHMARCMAIDHAKDGIRVNSLSPGPIATERTMTRIGSVENALAFYGPLTLLGRQGRVEEIANAALFLASEEAAYITGVVLPVDGGYSIGFSGMGAERPGIVSVNTDGT